MLKVRAEREPFFSYALDYQNVSDFDDFVEKLPDVLMTAIEQTEEWKFHVLIRDQNISNIDDLVIAAPEITYFLLKNKFNASWVEELQNVEFDPELPIYENILKVFRFENIVENSELTVQQLIKNFESADF